MGSHFPIGDQRERYERQKSNGLNLEPRHNNMRQFIGLWTLALVVVIFAAFSLESMGVAAYPNQPYQNGMRINRRGFKSSLLSTARGFGKRSDPAVDSMPAPYETIPYDPRVLAYLMKAEEAAGDHGGYHRADD